MFSMLLEKMHGVLSGGAKLENGALILNGNDSFVMTSAFEKDIQEKTLEAWVQLNDLNQKGSGVIGIQSTSERYEVPHRYEFHYEFPD